MHARIGWLRIRAQSERRGNVDRLTFTTVEHPSAGRLLGGVLSRGWRFGAFFLGKSRANGSSREPVNFASLRSSSICRSVIPIPLVFCLARLASRYLKGCAIELLHAEHRSSRFAVTTDCAARIHRTGPRTLGWAGVIVSQSGDPNSLGWLCQKQEKIVRTAGNRDRRSDGR